MTDRLPDAEFLRNLAKDMGLDLAEQDELDRLNEIADGLEWRPIAEAPKSDAINRTRVLLWLEDFNTIAFGYVYNFHGDVFAVADGYCGEITAKMFRPLPAPPVGTGEV